MNVIEFTGTDQGQGFEYKLETDLEHVHLSLTPLPRGRFTVHMSRSERIKNDPCFSAKDCIHHSGLADDKDELVQKAGENWTPCAGCLGQLTRLEQRTIKCADFYSATYLMRLSVSGIDSKSGSPPFRVPELADKTWRFRLSDGTVHENPPLEQPFFQINPSTLAFPYTPR